LDVRINAQVLSERILKRPSQENEYESKCNGSTPIKRGG
jgi:hypothetical protein